MVILPQQRWSRLRSLLSGLGDLALALGLGLALAVVETWCRRVNAK